MLIDTDGPENLDILSLATVPPIQSQESDKSNSNQKQQQQQQRESLSLPPNTTRSSEQLHDTPIFPNFGLGYLNNVGNTNNLGSLQPSTNTPDDPSGIPSRQFDPSLSTGQTTNFRNEPSIESTRRPRSFPAIARVGPSPDNSSAHQAATVSPINFSSLQMQTATENIVRATTARTAHILICPQPDCGLQFNSPIEWEYHVRFTHPRDPRPLLSLPASPENEVPSYLHHSGGEQTPLASIHPNWLLDVQNGIVPMERGENNQQSPLSSSIMDSIASRIAQSTLAQPRTLSDSPSALPASISTISNQSAEASAHQQQLPTLDPRIIVDQSFPDLSNFFAFGRDP